MEKTAARIRDQIIIFLFVNRNTCATRSLTLSLLLFHQSDLLSDPEAVLFSANGQFHILSDDTWDRSFGDDTNQKDDQLLVTGFVSSVTSSTGKDVQMEHNYFSSGDSVRALTPYAEDATHSADIAVDKFLSGDSGCSSTAGAEQAVGKAHPHEAVADNQQPVLIKVKHQKQADAGKWNPDAAGNELLALIAQEAEAENANDEDEDADKRIEKKEQIRILVAQLRKRLKASDKKEMTALDELEDQKQDLIQKLQSLGISFTAEDYKVTPYPPEFSYKTGPRVKRPPAVDEAERKRRKNEVNAAATRRRELRIIHDRKERQRQIIFLVKQNQELSEMVAAAIASN